MIGCAGLQDGFRDGVQFVDLSPRRRDPRGPTIARSLDFAKTLPIDDRVAKDHPSERATSCWSSAT
jgi:hypothetical protein